MISHDDWIRRAQGIDLTTRAQLRERMAHADHLSEPIHDETALEFEYFLRRELRKQLFVEEPSDQVRRIILHFATVRVQKQKTPAHVSIRELVKNFVCRSEERNVRTLRTLVKSGWQSVAARVPEPVSDSVLSMRSDSVLTRRISI